MSKGILEFTLPEEQEEFKTASNAYKYRLVLSEVDNHLRSRLKYEELSNEVHEALQNVRDLLHLELSEDGLDL